MRFVGAVAVLAAGVGLPSCGAAEGAFGVPWTAGPMRVRVEALPTRADPAFVRTAGEMLLTEQLFSPLLALPDDGRPGLGQIVSHEAGLVTIRLDAASGGNGVVLNADDVLWSWRRLVRPIGAVVPEHLPIKRMSAIADGRLLRLTREHTVRTRRAPFVDLRSAPGKADEVALSPGTIVDVLDSNLRRPCCGRSVRLSAPGLSQAELRDNESAAILAVRERGGRTELQLRTRSGLAGWAAESALAPAFPAPSLRRVVDRGIAARTLRLRDRRPCTTLLEDDVVDLVREESRRAEVVDPKSGCWGFVGRDTLAPLDQDRQWVLVADHADPDVLGWVPASDVTVDDSLIGARRIDDMTIEVEIDEGLASEVEIARALALLSLRPVARSAAATGHGWSVDAAAPTTGPFRIVSVLGSRLALARRGTTHAVDVELVGVADPIAALHLYRAGDVHVVLDGGLPDGVVDLLRSAPDFRGGELGGGLVAPGIGGIGVASPQLWRLRREAAR